MRRTARGLVTALGVLPVILAIPTPALAKVPPFTVEWAPRTPAVGQEATFTVRFWDDVAHTDRAGWVEWEFLEDLLWVVPSSAAAGDAIRLALVPERPGVLRGRIAFPTPGAWSVCMWKASCPVPEDAPGYPGRLEVIVEGDPTAPVAVDAASSPRERRDVATTPPLEEGRSSSPVPAAAAGVVVALAALAVGFRRVGLRRASPPERSAGRTR
jgi:hypothetical protein